MAEPDPKKEAPGSPDADAVVSLVPEPEPEPEPKHAPEPEPEPEPEPKHAPEPEPEPEPAGSKAGSKAGSQADGSEQNTTLNSSLNTSAGSVGSDGKPKKKKGRKKKEKPPKLRNHQERVDEYIGGNKKSGIRAVSDKLSEDVAELAQDMMSCINSRALFGENLADFVKGEMNESVFDALSQIVMKLDGLTVNAHEHEPKLKAASAALARVQKPAQAARDAAKEYQAAHKKLTGTLEKRKEGKGEWKDPKVAIWPPKKWKEAAERDRPSETEQLLDTLAEAFLGSRPKQGTWPLKSRKAAAKVFKEEVTHRQPLSGAADAKSKIYMGYVLEEAGMFSDAAESFQDALEALEEQSENLQALPFWQVQFAATEARFDALDTLSAEDEDERTAHKKLETALETVSTGAQPLPAPPLSRRMPRWL